MNEDLKHAIQNDISFSNIINAIASVTPFPNMDLVCFMSLS